MGHCLDAQALAIIPLILLALICASRENCIYAPFLTGEKSTTLCHLGGIADDSVKKHLRGGSAIK